MLRPSGATGRWLERFATHQHLLVAGLSLWLVATSPWVHLRRAIPRSAGGWDYSHIALGCAVFLLSITFLWSCLRRGGWRQYFPWACGELGQVGGDLSGLARGRLPTAGGAGLFALIEGLGLLSLFATAATGVAWLWYQGSSEALSWRQHHLFAARGLIAFLVLHAITASLHLLEFLRLERD